MKGCEWEKKKFQVGGYSYKYEQGWLRIFKKKFGIISASFDGAGDYLTIPDSGDFNLKEEKEMFKILETKENKNGSLDIKVEYTNETKTFLKEIYKKKKFSKSLVKKFVLESIHYKIDNSKYNKTK